MAFSKFRNIKVTHDGYTFDSKREYRRYCELKLLLKANLIRDLAMQPIFVVVPKTEKFREVRYIADFRYFDINTQQLVIEDVKGVKTKDFIIKQKLMWHVHKIEVICV